MPRRQTQTTATENASQAIQVRIPENYPEECNDVPVVEVNVKVGDYVKKNDVLITFEDRMKDWVVVQSEVEGILKKIVVNVGDRVSPGTLIALLEPPLIPTPETITKALASLLASRISENSDLDSERVRNIIAETLDELFLGESAALSRGDVFGLYGALAKALGIPEPPIAGPYVGTHEVLRSEFEFLAFTPHGSAAFRHLGTNRVLYVVIHMNQLLIGMFDPKIDNLVAFRKPDDALEWVRGGDAGKRFTNILWQLP